MNKGEYAIGVVRGTEGKDKTFLFKVTSQHDGIVAGVLAKNSHIQTLRSTVEVPIKDIVLNLGATPYPGKVHGCDATNLFAGKKLHDEFGNIHFFYKPDPEVGTK